MNAKKILKDIWMVYINLYFRHGSIVMVRKPKTSFVMFCCWTSIKLNLKIYFHTYTEHTKKKREPKWLSWREILKKSALFFGGEPFFFFTIMFGTKMELQRELSYGQPDGSPRRAILALFFFSVHNTQTYIEHAITYTTLNRPSFP